MGRDHRDILEVMMPMFSGTKDNYGKETPPPLPLSFDRVNEGQPPRSTSLLFTLPLEILAIVLQHVPPSSLASLALVSRDCRQLARSRQFSSIELDYSSSSLGLIACLMSEGQERVTNGGSTFLPSIGPCIRRITVATHPGWVSHRHNIRLISLEELDEVERKARLGNATETFFDLYIPSIQNILSHRSILPHLEGLDWEDKIVLPRFFFNNLPRSSIKYLKLFRVQVEEEFKITIPNTIAEQRWPIQTLHLELMPRLGMQKRVNTGPLCASLLRLCAPTLESLSWRNISLRLNDDKHSFVADGLGPAPRFARLRELRLGRFNFLDSSMLEAFLHDGLRSLDVDTEPNPVYKDFFRTRGTIPSLETFVCVTPSLGNDHPLDFLRANSQLLKLCLDYDAPVELLERKVLPLLSRSFSRLTSLRLTWEGTYVSNSALGTISTLKSLKQVCISAGNQFGWRHDWLIDHKSMRKFLQRLPCLEKLAFSRDSYDNGIEWSHAESYYEHRFSVGDISGDANSRTKRWEQKHRVRMLNYANAYVRLLPKLDWLYFGQIPMEVRLRKNGARVAVVLAEERDDCYTLLRRMFGGQVD